MHSFGFVLGSFRILNTCSQSPPPPIGRPNKTIKKRIVISDNTILRIKVECELEVSILKADADVLVRAAAMEVIADVEEGPWGRCCAEAKVEHVTLQERWGDEGVEHRSTLFEGCSNI